MIITLYSPLSEPGGVPILVMEQLLSNHFFFSFLALLILMILDK